MFGMITDLGMVRSLNEDYVGYLINDNIKLFIVADGMGGHNAGEIASKTAVETVKSYFEAKQNILKENLLSDFKEAITYANEKIFNISNEKKECRGMGTTITACIMYEDKTLIANVGDSSCFIIEKDNIIKITKDHSLVQQLVDKGSITEEEAVNHPNKNVITRAVGTYEHLEIDIFDISDIDMDMILLCTDGLTNDIPKDELYNIINKNSCASYDELCKKIIEEAKKRGGRDNISLILVKGEQDYDDRNDIRR
ncbi:Stp1/IreP family PP2C-type Ser/Thr phosphatase [Clostridium algidicarnis]|uniref:Stp1/IreP family PP2C-type Ser/Thr phosphatase n=1 Tax=Clostridium algidicarnis TaxID=37659 RepID=UPI0004980CD8|nr:Stp1/IreP family PP2C-type Ser/Thr phosphatase [Clostridium algidicarnis]